MQWPWVMLWRLVRGKPDAAAARALFLQERPRLEAAFFEAVKASGKPRGLRWKGCEWAAEVELARERASGQLAALVGITVQFEAVEGSDMEGLPAVGNLRNATAVFFFQGGRWHTTGRTLFNLNPDEALERLSPTYERLTSGKG